MIDFMPDEDLELFTVEQHDVVKVVSSATSVSIFWRYLPFWCMLIAAMCAGFTQYQPVGACVLMFHGSYLVFLHVSWGRLRVQWSGTLLVSFCLMLSMSQIFRKNEDVPWDWVSVSIVFALETVVMHAFWLVGWLHLRLVKQVYYRYVLFCYPVLVSTMYAAVARYSPIGSHGSLGYGMHEWQSFIQVVCLVGLTGLNFVIVCVSALVAYCVIELCLKRTSPEPLAVSLEPTRYANTAWYHGVGNKETRRWEFAAKFAFILFMAVWLFGSLRLISPYMYQKGVGSTAIPAADWVDTMCIVWPDGIDPLVTTANELAINDSIELVLWSETAGGQYFDDRKNESLTSTQIPRYSDLSTQIGSLALQYNVTIGATYELWAYPENPNSEMLYNMFSFWNSNGQNLFDYAKRHPVPVMEWFILKGPIDSIGAGVSSNVGGINAAICFDLDFPDFIQPGLNSGLLIQSASTWGVVGYFHGINSSFRAIENGTYLVRCGARGPSGVWDTYGNSISYLATSGTDTLYFQVPRNPDRVWTVYSNFGFIFDYLLFTGSCFFIIIIIIKFKLPMLPN